MDKKNNYETLKEYHVKHCAFIVPIQICTCMNELTQINLSSTECNMAGSFIMCVDRNNFY